MSDQDDSQQLCLMDHLSLEMGGLMSIVLIYHKLEERAEAVDLGYDLAKGERLILINLYQPRRMGELARELHVLPSSFTAMADNLEALGLAERLRDPDDRRAWLLSLTEKGADLRNHICDTAVELVRGLLDLPEDKQTALLSLLRDAGAAIYRTGVPKGLEK